jgi:hypothetical protein
VRRSRARDRGGERCRPENDVLTVECAVALANRHCRLARAVPDVVKRFVLESKPEIPVPVFFVPSGLKKVKSDCKNFPSWIMYGLHLPFLTIGFPSFGKTSSPGPNRRRIARAAFDRSPGHLAARTDCGFGCDSHGGNEQRRSNPAPHGTGSHAKIGRVARHLG